jgi:hypothetical protein
VAQGKPLRLRAGTPCSTSQSRCFSSSSFYCQIVVSIDSFPGIRSRVDEPQRNSVRFLKTNDLAARQRFAAYLLISCVKFSGS